MRLLQTCNFSLPALLSLLVGFRLRNATILDFLIVLKHSIQLCLQSIAVCRILRNGLVKANILLGLVLHILLHGSSVDLILLGGLLVLLLGGCLFGLLLSQVLGEVGLSHFQYVDNAAPGT